MVNIRTITTPPTKAKVNAASDGGYGLHCIYTEYEDMEPGDSEFEYYWPDYCGTSTGESGGIFKPISGNKGGADPYTRWTFNKKDGTVTSQPSKMLSIPGGATVAQICTYHITDIAPDGGTDPVTFKTPEMFTLYKEQLVAPHDNPTFWNREIHAGGGFAFSQSGAPQAISFTVQASWRVPGNKGLFTARPFPVLGGGVSFASMTSYTNIIVDVYSSDGCVGYSPIAEGSG